jgi:ribonucleoside-triphosphate reductase
MERQKCEIYSRVVGFLTPVSQWNRGKKEEFKDRKTYDKVLGDIKRENEKSYLLAK